MATKGEQGSPPDYRSIYFPNAGHVVMRTGWGPQHRYLFMDAGPVARVTAKRTNSTSTSITVAISYWRAAGRGSYSGGPFAPTPDQLAVTTQSSWMVAYRPVPIRDMKSTATFPNSAAG
ncbi:MAG: hypothetical protein R3C49_21825 [Planctomycetaceae bacterium]